MRQNVIEYMIYHFGGYKMLHDNLTVNENGELLFAGQNTVELAKKYKTPLYLIDEDNLRKRCATYKRAIKKHFDCGDVLYASKALSFKEIYRIMANENMCVDVVSGGELYTAHLAGFPMGKVYFHGSNKTPEEIDTALDFGVGCFVCDGKAELDRLNAAAQARGIRQNVLLRLTPGIDTHTYEAVRTGQVDSKFGTPIETGQAEELVRYMLTLKAINPMGFHCHVGSQVFDGQTFCDSADIMIDFIKKIREETGWSADVLDLGGGFGVRYVPTDPVLDIEKTICDIARHIKGKCAQCGISVPKILLEPGRSIVADSGLTLYTVGGVKTIRGYKSYVSIDGGMTDNPRYALYKSAYGAIIANRAAAEPDFLCTVAGKCCESGDIIAQNIRLASPATGDILAVEVTGAYNYSMASNYNRIPRPPVVMLRGGESRLAVKRETYDDIVRNDI